MDDTLEKALLIVVGWLLGLLGPAITNEIKTKRENAAGRRAIRSELRDVAHKLAYCDHLVRRHLGETSREDFLWMQRHLETHSTFEDSSEVLKAVKHALTLDDDAFSKWVKEGMAEPHHALELQAYPVPLLDSRVSALWSFDDQFQRTLLQIRTRLSQLERLAERSEAQLDKTFSEMTRENRERLYQNINSTWRQYAKTARKIVDLVDTIEHE